MPLGLLHLYAQFLADISKLVRKLAVLVEHIVEKLVPQIEIWVFRIVDHLSEINFRIVVEEEGLDRDILRKPLRLVTNVKMFLSVSKRPSTGAPGRK